MKVWRGLLIISLIVSSCSTRPLSSKDAEQLVDYVKASHMAQSDPAKACEMFGVLATQKDFILTDVAHVRSLRLCDREKTALNWDRPVPAWLEKERGTIYFQTLPTAMEKGLYVQKNPQFFLSPERVQIYQAALAQKDITPEDKKIIEEALHNIAPRFLPDPKEKDYIRIVKDYKSVREFTKARGLLNKLINSKTTSLEEKFNAHKELFYVNKLQRDQNRELYMRSAKSWANFIKPNTISSPQNLRMYYEAQMNYIRVVWTDQGAAAALKDLEKFEKAIQGKHSLYEVYWLRARMWDEQKKSAEAVAEMERAAKEQISQWRDKEKIVWSLAWTYFKSQKYPEAEAHLTSMIESPDVSAYARFKYLYWKGEAQNRQNKTEDAQKTWEQLLNEDIFGYYNLLAHSQLDRPLKDYRPKDEFSPQKILSSDDEKVFYSLQKVEEFDLAARLVNFATSGVSLNSDVSADYISSFFHLYAQIKNYKYIFQIFNQLPYELQRDVFLKIPNVLYPHPYDEATKEAADRTRLEPELIYSIMRQESSFDPKARSPMDAFGLLQILPEVAKRVANENKITYSNYEDLFDEQKNIAIGSSLLRKQATSFNNKFVLYVASYNASSSAVRNWHSRYNGDDLMFIEDIPYEETKAYVKLVLRNYIIYKKLKYGEDFKRFPRTMLALSDEGAKTPPQ